ncbi:MAG TPA: Maf family protein [Rhodanobacteraceae bacterium]|nr:Maf family protein [Rhodanobacteraceae bacterium]
MLYLASRSPRRRQLLAQLGVPFEPLDIEVPEQRAAGEGAAQYVERVARDKALAGRAQARVAQGDWVLAADTEVILGDEVFGKPADAAAAAAMLRRLAGREHVVVSAVWLVGAAGEHHALVTSTVCFGPLDEPDIAAYVATGECFGKAGGYAIQGRGATLVRHLEGSWSGVVGLPLYETAALLRAAGLAQ